MREISDLFARVGGFQAQAWRTPPVLLGGSTFASVAGVGSGTVQVLTKAGFSLLYPRRRRRRRKASSGCPRQTQEVSSALSGLASVMHSPPPVSAPPAGKLSGILKPCFIFHKCGLENIIDPRDSAYIPFYVCAEWQEDVYRTTHACVQL